MWSIKDIEWFLILVGNVIHGIKLLVRKLFKYSIIFSLFSDNKLILISPSTIAKVLSLIWEIVLFRAELKWFMLPFGCL